MTTATARSALPRIAIGQHSEAGPKPVNQDFHGAATPSDSRLATKGLALALADGIGSSAVSQVASAAAVRGFLDDYYCTSDAWPVKRAGQCVIEATNSWLHGLNQSGDARFDKDRGQVCTFTALIFKARDVHLLHVGDARVYRLHPQALEQLTEDHRIAVPGGTTHLARALGVSPRIEIDYRCWAAEPGEVYLLATDGAYEHLDAAMVQAALAANPDDLDTAARTLVTEALARGGDDNATVQLARVLALPEPDAQQLASAGRALALPPPLAPRQDFEGYTIVRELHASPRSHLHLAVDAQSGQTVVLKTPAVDVREQQDHLDSMMLEEWVARRVDSPHVLKAHDSGRARQHLFVALEYLEGESLAQWMRDHPRPSMDAVRGMIEQAARGLQALHRKSMLHQDLRPENLMIDAQGTVKLIDLGSVHVAGLTEGTPTARPEAIRGSLQYTAPEYFTGEGGSEASDLFSLAVLTYQMLTGELPYGLQVARIQGSADVAKLNYTPARHFRPDLPVWLDSVLRQALHPRPERRQQALSEFVHQLSEPGADHLKAQRAPLVERDPVRFWRGLSLGLAATMVGLLFLLLRRG